MPLAQLKGLSRPRSAGQKAELIRKVTDAIVSVEGVPLGDWGVGGTAVTTKALKNMAVQGR